MADKEPRETLPLVIGGEPQCSLGLPDCDSFIGSKSKFVRIDDLGKDSQYDPDVVEKLRQQGINGHTERVLSQLLEAQETPNDT